MQEKLSSITPLLGAAAADERGAARRAPGAVPTGALKERG
jgi:hypothetical protein